MLTNPSRYAGSMTRFPLTDRFALALAYAQEWHTEQYRKGTSIPYISHLLGVAAIALEFGATEDQAIAALLHDSLEDGPEYTGIDADQLAEIIRLKFGERVQRLVEGATDATPKAGEAKKLWRERKLDYLAKLHTEDASALLVSASDKLHNARTILTDVLTLPVLDRSGYFNRFKMGKEGTLQYYRLLADTYRQAPGGRDNRRLQELFAELERTVAALEEASGVTKEEVRGYPLLAAFSPS